MTELGPGTWPTAPIKTERLLLRAPEAHDRAGFVELFTSPEVHTYLGGPRPLYEFEREVPEISQRPPGLFVIELDGAMVGMVKLARHDPDRPGNRSLETGETELGYLLLPQVWGRGYGAEACAAALDWFADVRPGESVVLYTQTANEPSMRLAAKLGFTEVERFVAYGAEQWFGVWPSVTPPA